MTAPNIDPDAFEEVKSEMGEIFSDVLQAFIDTTPEQMQALNTAIENNDAEKIFSNAHRLKSSASSIGATGMAETAEQIEMIGRAGGSDGAAELYPELQSKLEDVTAFLQQQLKQL